MITNPGEESIADAKMKAQYDTTLLMMCGVAFLIIFPLSTVLMNYNIKIEKVKDASPDTTKSISMVIKSKYNFNFKYGYKTTKLTDIKFTAYNNHPNQTDSSPNITGSGRQVYEGSIAISQDLLRKVIYYGDIVYVKKLNRYFVVEDAMNKRHKRRMDIFLFDYDTAKNTLFTSNVIVLRQMK